MEIWIYEYINININRRRRLEKKKTRREVNYIPDDTITAFTEKFLNLISIVNVEQTVRHDKAMNIWIHHTCEHIIWGERAHQQLKEHM